MSVSPPLVGHIHNKGIKATIGNDTDTAAAMSALGAEHVNCNVDDIVVDEAQKVISTPAYMLAQSISEASTGIQKAMNKLVELA